MAYLDPDLVIKRLQKTCQRRGAQTELIKFFRANGKPKFNKGVASRWVTGTYRPSLDYIVLIQKWLDKGEKRKK